MVSTAVHLARRFGGAIPALPVPDLLNVGDTGFLGLAARGGAVRVQTPQAFAAQPLLQAYRAAEQDGFEGTDTSSCVETYTSVEVRTFVGDQRNLKVTYAPDIAVAATLLNDR
jgi:2-C-methyl-D-erythritol 4-phosphate cytidylyltransferase